MIFLCYINVLNKPLINGYSSREGAMCVLVYCNKIKCLDLAKGIGLRMDKIHYHVVKFIDGVKE